MNKSNLIIILISILYSCNNNSYKKEFEEKIKENLEDRRPLINDKLNSIELSANEMPNQFEEIKIISNKLNTILSVFFENSLKSNNIETLNSIRDNTFKNLLELKKKNLKIDTIIQLLDKPINNELDKFKCLDKVNKHYLEALELFYIMGLNRPYTFKVYNDTRVYSSRINDSIVVLNFANRIVKEYPNFFEPKNFLKINLKDSKTTDDIPTIINDDFIKYDFIASYHIKTSADTLNLKMSLETKKSINVVLSKDEIKLIVGTRAMLNTDFDFLKLIKNEK